MKPVLRYGFCLTVGLSIFGSIRTGEAQVYQGKQLVKAELLADTGAIAAGKQFTAGLLLRMAPGWHTYWQYSGDAGLPTELNWKLPPGWKAGELQWPIPIKLKDPGDILTYGYNDEVLLMQTITPPDKIDTGEIRLSAEANWLVCEKICIPGSATLELKLLRATSSHPANAELFTRYRRLLPQNPPHGNEFIGQWTRSGSDISFTARAPGLARHAFVDLYPLPEQKALVGHPNVERRGEDQVAFKVPFEGEAPTHLRGVIVVGATPTDESRAGWYFEAGTRSQTQSSTSPVLASASRGLPTYLLFAFLGGLILNLMPCVLPVISLKIFGFVKQAGQDRQRIFRSGLAFTAGMFAWFIGLAVLLIALKMAGRQITWALQFTNAYFVLALSVVVLVFALNLFGVFEITLPQSATRNVLSTTERKDDLGSFFQGVFATVLATPCTAPFLGTALGFAFTQSAPVILAMFVAVAAGMSAPYLLLSAQPAWLRFLPKPGPWMEHVKQLMGFLLLATLLFLLYVLGAQRGYEALIWASGFLLVVSVACWMKGAFISPITSLARRTLVLVLMFVLVLGSGFYFISGKFRNTAMATSTSIRSRLESELAQGHPVFVDFTAAWCLTCKFNEKAVLNSAEVRDAFARYGVTKLVADWTNGDPEITAMLQQFGRPGVPLYVLYPGKSGEPIVFPELLTKNMVLEKLETVSHKIASQSP